ncbi:MAG: FkbM family methyltransferase [Nitrososphaeraceae archaeon]|nr:FkbM family methyltransferase [Nitrososphaeraceae archaeon]
MTSAVSEALDWLKGSKYGYKFKDKIVLFLYILNATIILIFTHVIFGKNKTLELYFHRSLLINWMPFKSVVIEREGIKLLLPMIIDYIIVVKSDWEKEERAFLRKLDLQKKDNNNDNDHDDFIIDVGANIGFYTILLAKRYPNYKVISIEASKKLFKQLEGNCNLNELDTSSSSRRITLINKAITDIAGKKIDFYEIESLSTLLKEFLLDLPTYDKKNNALFCTEIVETTTIDSIVKSENIMKIWLIKIDVEGAEVLTLNGAIQTLKQRKIKTMIIEFHSRENHHYIIRLLEELGYSVSFSKERPGIYEDPKYINGHIIAELIE